MSAWLSETGLFDGCYPSGVEPHDIRVTCDAANLRDGAQRLWTPVLLSLSDGPGGVQPEIERSRLAANANLAVLDPLREDDPLKVISKEMPEYMSVLRAHAACGSRTGLGHAFLRGADAQGFERALKWTEGQDVAHRQSPRHASLCQECS